MTSVAFFQLGVFIDDANEERFVTEDSQADCLVRTFFFTLFMSLLLVRAVCFVLAFCFQNAWTCGSLPVGGSELDLVIVRLLRLAQILKLASTYYATRKR